MQKRFVVRVLSVLVPVATGVLIVAISLVAAARVQSKDTSSITSRRLYLGKEILPDNVLYPALMAADRVKLELAGPEEKIHLQVLYAKRRLEVAESLMDKGESELALSTFTKAQKYLLQAAQGAQSPEASDQTRQLVIDAIAQYTQGVEVCRQEHEGASAPELSALNHEVQMAGDALNSDLHN